MEKYITEKSRELYKQLSNVLVDGTASSFHKAPIEEYPIIFSGGSGSKLYDVDGNEYIDYVLGMGPLILGHAPASVAKAVSRQAALGSVVAAPSEKLLQLCSVLIAAVLCAEVVAFQNTGTEAVMLALRLARAYTGKEKIIKFEGQYHGWSDEEKWSIDAQSIEELGPREKPARISGSLGQNTESGNQLIILPWNDTELLKAYLELYGDTIAAVIMEPFMLDSGPIMPRNGYLEMARELTKKHNVLLIFDEVITGFRMALGGAQEYYGIMPDLAVLAKAIAGGYPLSAVVGKRDIMQCGVHPSGTFNGNSVSVAAALATLQEISQPGFYDQFDELGELLTEGLIGIGRAQHIEMFAAHFGGVCMLTLGVAQERPLQDFRDFLLRADTVMYDKFYLLALQYGIRLTYRRGRIYLSAAHTNEDVEKTLAVCSFIFRQIKER